MNPDPDSNTDSDIKDYDVIGQSKKRYVTKAPAQITDSSLVPLDFLTNYQEPKRFDTEAQIEDLIMEISKQKNVSDIIISPDMPIAIKTKGKGLLAISHRVLDITEAETMVKIISGNDSVFGQIREGVPASGLAKILDYEDNGESKYTKSGLRSKSRFRYEVTACATARNEDSFSAILRPLPVMPLRYDQLGMSEEFVNDFIINDGTVIVAGATGEGKSSTLSSVIRYILENDTIIKGIIITHEDPIEVGYDVIPTRHSKVFQSSISPSGHIESFETAEKSAMRRSPDLAFIGELRDGDTISAAITLSLTGHPVYATVHANDVPSILPRLVSRYPKEVQTQKLFDIIETTRLLVAQKLLWDVDDNIFAVREKLKFTPQLRNYLKPFAKNPDILYKKIGGIMDQGLLGSESYKMQGDKLLRAGRIDIENYNKVVEGSNDFDIQTLNLLDSL